jgi:DNA-binding XRE family transcriptional regulator
MKINIKNLRKETGKTQEEFAYNLGVVKSTYCRWERDNYIPFANDLHNFCNLVGIKMDDVQ